MSDFQIERSITKEDIPPSHQHKKSKYDPIYNSCKTLEKGEGIQVAVEKSHVVSVLGKGLQSRHPRRRYSIKGRSRPNGYRIYIIREK